MCRADKVTTQNVPFVLKSGSLTLLETSDPVQTSIGMVLSLFENTFVHHYVGLIANEADIITVRVIIFPCESSLLCICTVM